MITQWHRLDTTHAIALGVACVIAASVNVRLFYTVTNIDLILYYIITKRYVDIDSLLPMVPANNNEDNRMHEKQQ